MSCELRVISTLDDGEKCRQYLFGGDTGKLSRLIGFSLGYITLVWLRQITNRRHVPPNKGRWVVGLVKVGSTHIGGSWPHSSPDYWSHWPVEML